MPPSMRRQTQAIKKAASKHSKRVESRKHALKLLRTRQHSGKGKSNREIAILTSVPRCVVNKLNMGLKESNKALIDSIVSMNSRAGRKTVLSAEEEQLIVRKLLFGASRRAAVGYERLRYMMSRVAADGSKGYKNIVLSDAALRSFRARHRELTFRAQESTEAAKLSAETEAHVAPFFKLLSEIGDRNPGLLKNPHRIWNLDETRVDYIFGKKKKVFTSATSHHGVFQKM